MITETKWHGMPAWLLENQAASVVILPEVGAKIASLLNKATGYEWIVGPGDRPVQTIEYGATFTDQDMSGWDEMFPTINACFYPAPGQYHGVPLPDHGEVWALPWRVDQVTSERIKLSVEGRALPYLLERTATLHDDGTLRLEYRATNKGGEPMPYLWAGHPQFTAELDTRIVLPPEVTEVYNVLDFPQWGPPGTIYPWPEATLADGRTQRLDRIAPVTAHDCRKVYVMPGQHISWAELVAEETGNTLRLEWPPEKAPYLGLWVDEGTFNTVPAVAPEPATGFYDSLEWAYGNGQVSVLAPGASDEWYVNLRVSKSENSM
jgi:galactose mutarotase-like enzyme